MATSTTTTRAKKNETGPGEGEIDGKGIPNDKPTRDEIYDAALMVARKTNLVPTVIGPTASGKTYGFAKIAPEHNAEVVTVLLGQHTPDEIAGFQLAIQDKLVIQMPFWFREAQAILDRGKNAWILFDELGISREETRGALYTFMRDRHLHGHALKPKSGNEVLVFAASNPATFAPPFKSRCLFLSVPADKEYLKTISTGSSFVSKIVDLAQISDESDPFYSNAEPPAPLVINAAATKALKDLTNDPTFWKLSEPARYVVLAGLVPHQTLAAVLKDNNHDMSALARDWKELDRALRTLPKDQMHGTINNVLQAFPGITPEERIEAILTILDNIYNDITGDNLQIYFSTSHSEDVAKSLLEVDPETMKKRLAERGLLEIVTNSKGNVAKGSIVERLEKMVAYSEANPS